MEVFLLYYKSKDTAARKEQGRYVRLFKKDIISYISK